MTVCVRDVVTEFYMAILSGEAVCRAELTKAFRRLVVMGLDVIQLFMLKTKDIRYHACPQRIQSTWEDTFSYYDCAIGIR